MLLSDSCGPKTQNPQHPQTDCATCVVQMWCSYKCGSCQMNDMDKDGSSALSPPRSWMMWVEISVIEPVRAAFLLPCSRVATLAVNMSTVCKCAAHRCQNNCLTSLCPAEYPLQTLTCLAHSRGEKRLKTKFSDVHRNALEAEIQKWFWDQDISFRCWAMGNPTVCNGRCLNYVERQGTNIHILSYALLVSISSVFLKQIRKLSLTFLHVST
jgi:hypothetical protein